MSFTTMFLSQCFQNRRQERNKLKTKMAKEKVFMEMEEEDDMMDVCSETGDADEGIHKLPTEIMVHLFGFLEVAEINNLRLVCKYWKELSDSPQIWRSLCMDDFNVCSAEPKRFNYKTLYEKDWRKFYVELTHLCGEGVWKGMSKWVEPKGFDHEQETTVTLEFPRKTKKIVGQGSTVNYNTPSAFTIEGSFSNSTKFTWAKHFATHTSNYEGELDLETSTLQGKIDYDDGRTKWKGVFLYKRKSLCEES